MQVIKMKNASTKISLAKQIIIGATMVVCLQPLAVFAQSCPAPAPGQQAPNKKQPRTKKVYLGRTFSELECKLLGQQYGAQFIRWADGICWAIEATTDYP